MKYRYGYARIPAPSEPTMMHGRRPMRSERLPMYGMRTMAMALPMTGMNRYSLVFMPTPYAALVAKVPPKVVASVATPFISEMQMTRTMFGQLSRMAS
jgi:hypothetical protein